MTEKRNPAFMGDGNGGITTFGNKKFLWGNLPAIDVLKLRYNEGLGYQGSLDMLFAGE